MASPTRLPATVPTTPMVIPTEKKTAVMDEALAPMALSTPISLRFSATRRTRWPMRAKAATSTMMVTTTNSASFSSCSALKRLRFISIQSRTQYGKPSRPATARPTRLASKGSSRRTSTPVTPASPAKSRAARSRLQPAGAQLRLEVVTHDARVEVHPAHEPAMGVAAGAGKQRLLEHERRRGADAGHGGDACDHAG